MVKMNEFFYLERVPQAYKRNSSSAKNTPRNWWIVKPDSNKNMKGRIQLPSIIFPKKMIGKRIRIHIEVIKDV